MAKDLRRNCDNPTCGKLYRYSSAKSKYCGNACKNRVARARKAEEERAAEEARWARAQGTGASDRRADCEAGACRGRRDAAAHSPCCTGRAQAQAQALCLRTAQKEDRRPRDTQRAQALPGHAPIAPVQVGKTVNEKVCHEETAAYYIYRD